MKILLFHASAGYGHKKVAEVVAKEFRLRGLSQDEVKVIDALDLTSKFFADSYRGIYFNCVKYIPDAWGWVYELLDKAKVYRWVRPIRSRYNRIVGQKLLDLVRQENPDHIICTHFLSAELFASAKLRGEIQATLTTVITDFYPHTFWVNEGTDFYWVMNDVSKADLLRRGVDEKKVMARGMPVDSIFKPTGRRNEILSKWRFAPDRFTLLITSGSFGLGPYSEILRNLSAYGDRLQCFVVCGNNQEMKAALDKERFDFPVQVFGFVNFMDELMEASDLLLAKPGGATTVESLAKGVPMIVLNPIPGQETRNARFLKEQDASFFMKSPDEIKPIFQAIFEYPELMDAKCKAVAAVAKPHATDDLVSFILKTTAH